jgi:purine-binding chemotaxis protein CheW
MEDQMELESGRSSEERQYVLFVLGLERYGVEIGQVQEIVAPQALTNVPGAPAWVEGVTNLRGQVIPVLDLASRLSVTPGEETDQRRIVVVDVGFGKVGMRVDAVTEVALIANSVIEPPSALAMGISAHYVSGLAKREADVIVLLDLEAVLTPEEARTAFNAQEDTLEPATAEGQAV